MARRVDPELRERVLRAATATFAANGFAATAMEAVGRAAGVTKGGVYFHFRSKEELFFAVLDHWRGASKRALDEALAAVAGGTGAALLRATLGGYLAFHFAEPAVARLLRVLGSELHGRFTAAIREDAREEHRALRARLREILIRGSRDGTLFAGDPVQASLLLAAGVHGVVDQWLAAPGDVEPFLDPEGLAEALAAPYATGQLTGRSEDDESGAAGHEFRPLL